MSGQKAVGGIILAAGASVRMGQPKLLYRYGQKTIIGHVLDNALAAQLSPLLLISGAYREEVEAEAAARGVRAVYNPDYAAGQSGSLQAGIAALPPDTAAMFLLGDQPLVPPEVIRQLLEAYQSSDAPIVVPKGGSGMRGNPTIFAPSLFAEINDIEGDIGARQVMAAHIDEVCFVDIGDRAVNFDVDTPEDLKLLELMTADNDRP
ncbi:MAG: nucleotidyltransferase family protein [Bacillota bacterium]|nr:nucleotidyltransferase family protein [Bacillota bacterium]